MKLVPAPSLNLKTTSSKVGKVLSITSILTEPFTLGFLYMKSFYAS